MDTEINKKILDLKKRIENSCKKCMRNSNEIKIIAVTKYAQMPAVNEVISFGLKTIGENRIQEALDKFEGLLPCEKHFIGTLQTNKVKIAVKHFDVIQSVDSIKLASEIDKECKKIGKTMPIFAEINIGKEENKHGVFPEETMDFCNKLTKLTNLKLIGIMCIAPYFEENEIEKVRSYFSQMKELKNKLGVKELSMGMSNDFEIAIEEGSTMVRIGRAIFG